MDNIERMEKIVAIKYLEHVRVNSAGEIESVEWNVPGQMGETIFQGAIDLLFDGEYIQ